MNVDKKVLVGWEKNYNWPGVSSDGRVANVQSRTSAHKGSMPKPECTEPPWSLGLQWTDKHGRHETNCHCKPMHSLRFRQGAWPPRTGSQKTSSLVSRVMASFLMAIPMACLLALCLRWENTREGHENVRKKWTTEVWDCVLFDP